MVILMIILMVVLMVVLMIILMIMERDNLKECAMGLIKQKDEMENNIKKLLEDMEMYIQKGDGYGL